jgi:hypothetical protein
MAPPATRSQANQATRSAAGSTKSDPPLAKNAETLRTGPSNGKAKAPPQDASPSVKIPAPAVESSGTRQKEPVVPSNAPYSEDDLSPLMAPPVMVTFAPRKDSPPHIGHQSFNSPRYSECESISQMRSSKTPSLALLTQPTPSISSVSSLPNSSNTEVPAAPPVTRNAAAFGVDGRLGHIEAKADIPLKLGIQPISAPMYGAPPAKREVIDKQAHVWYEAGVIEPSKSPWGFPAVVVCRNGKPRFAVDYRKLNARTAPDKFPISRQSEVIQALSGSQVLSSFDALAGFTQLEVAEDAKEKAAFRCHLGLWQFRRMPFGLCNGPSIFQRAMQGVLSPFLWLFALAYIDNVVVFSKSREDHLVRLDKVLGAIASAGIALPPTKCFVGYSSILLLGQKVSRLGLSTHLEKVRAIVELDRPKSLADLQKFLGMAVYFSSNIPFYSFIASPLSALLRKGGPGTLNANWRSVRFRTRSWMHLRWVTQFKTLLTGCTPTPLTLRWALAFSRFSRF